MNNIIFKGIVWIISARGWDSSNLISLVLDSSLEGFFNIFLLFPFFIILLLKLFYFCLNFSNLPICSVNF